MAPDKQSKHTAEIKGSNDISYTLPEITGQKQALAII